MSFDNKKHQLKTTIMGLGDKFNQMKDLANMAKQAKTLQKQLAAIETEVIEDNIKIVITGDQKIKVLEIDGVYNKKLLEALNKALKKSQQVAATKMSQQSGGLSGMLKNFGN